MGIEQQAARVGSFVLVRESGDGIGRLLAVDKTTATVEYFVSPVGPRLEHREVSAARVVPIELPAQTIIFWKDPALLGWRQGRVDGAVAAAAIRSKEDHYFVHFPNRESARIPISQVQVRWAHPLEDPTELLAARVTESPYFVTGRQGVLEHLAHQRVGFAGMTGIAGASIQYLPHQLAIVRRVLADPVQRYLLADEVGLGKTIEAGMLIRQHILEEGPDARVFVIVPAHLEDQWCEELADHFGFDGEPRIAVLGHEGITDDVLAAMDSPSLVVVDEAHQVARWAWAPGTADRKRYRSLETLAKTSPKLLLLTGTPLLHEEDGFLAMLHLLDPIGYPLDDRSGFRRRIEERQTVADCVADLTDDAPELFAREAIARLSGAFGGDDELIRLSAEVEKRIALPEDSPERVSAIRALRVHVTEGYRLHRRMLRTRREDRHVVSLLPSRRGIEWIEATDAARDSAESFLEDWRSSLPSTALAPAAAEAGVFANFVEACLSHPRVLLRRIDERIGGIARDLTPSFAGEASFLHRWSATMRELLREDSRANALLAWLRAQKSAKAIIFVDDGDTAQVVHQTLAAAFGPRRVALHSATESSALERFRSGAADVLVCDRASEEGLNLQQSRAAMVLYDCPLDPLRIEQRLGRVDRLEGMKTLKIFGLRSSGEYERKWQTCLVDGVRVFNRSIAPLQYTLAESMRRVRAELVIRGAASFDEATVHLTNKDSGLDAELRKIRSQEALDSVEWNVEEEQAFVEKVQDASERAQEDGAPALGAWLERCLQYERRGDEVFHYVHRLGGPKPTLVPITESIARFKEYRDQEAQSRPDEMPLGPFTFDSDIAESDGASLLRVGHPFVESVEQMVRSDGRGTAWVLWRVHPELAAQIPELYLGFQFVIEPDHRAALSVASELPISASAIARRAERVLPRRVVKVWSKADGSIVTDPKLLPALDRPYQSRKLGGPDVHVRTDRWQLVDQRAPSPDWEERCLRVRRAAERHLTTQRSFIDACEQAANDVRRQLALLEATMRTRLGRLQGAARASEEKFLELEQRVSDAIVDAVRRPRVSVDSCGAIFLSRDRLGEESE